MERCWVRLWLLMRVLVLGMVVVEERVEREHRSDFPWLVRDDTAAGDTFMFVDVDLDLCLFYDFLFF